MAWQAKLNKRRFVVVRYLVTFYDNIQSWLALTIVGALMGLFAAIIDIGSMWALDLKFGVCSRGFWINRSLCCKDSPNLLACPDWRSWRCCMFAWYVAWRVVGFMAWCMLHGMLHGMLYGA